MTEQQAYQFTFREPQEVGFVVHSDDKERVWPRFAEVYLRVAPTARGRGLSFFHFPVARPDTQAHDVLPTWATNQAELGALHACLVGGPGGIPLTDLRVELLGGKLDEQGSGERAFFVAGYMAVRQAVHLATRHAPVTLEYAGRVTLTAAAQFASRLQRELIIRCASAIEVSSPGTAGASTTAARRVEIAAEVPWGQVEGLRRLLSRLELTTTPDLAATPIGYRTQTRHETQRLLAKLSPPLDWPAPGDDTPRTGGPFPELLRAPGQITRQFAM